MGSKPPVKTRCFSHSGWEITRVSHRVHTSEREQHRTVLSTLLQPRSYTRLIPTFLTKGVIPGSDCPEGNVPLSFVREAGRPFLLVFKPLSVKTCQESDKNGAEMTIIHYSQRGERPGYSPRDPHF